MTIAHIKKTHPEFQFEGKWYRHRYTGEGYLYLNSSNEWKDVPKGWTRILRELPTMEQFALNAKESTFVSGDDLLNTLDKRSKKQEAKQTAQKHIEMLRSSAYTENNSVRAKRLMCKVAKLSAKWGIL